MSGGDYFSLDSILRGDTQVPVKMEVELTKGLADTLDAPAGSGEVKELPLWLARELDAKGFLSAGVPKTHKKNTLAALKVDASKHSLAQLNPYYYAAGVDFAIMTGNESSVVLVQDLKVSFTRRYKDILERYDNDKDRNAGTFTKTLSSEERRLYESGRKSSVHHNKWKGRKLERIQHAPILHIAKKQLSRKQR